MQKLQNVQNKIFSYKNYQDHILLKIRLSDMIFELKEIAKYH